jgi:hypothetical protein
LDVIKGRYHVLKNKALLRALKHYVRIYYVTAWADGLKTIGLYYQCEVLARWFPKELWYTIQTHKNSRMWFDKRQWKLFTDYRY